MRCRRFYLVPIIVLALAGCGKKEDVTPSGDSKYYVVSKIEGSGFPTGNISTYVKPGEVLVDEAFKLAPKGTTEWVADLVISGEHMYLARAISSSVEIVRLSDLTVVNSVSYGKASTGNYFRHIEATPERIIVADRAFISRTSNDSQSFLKIIHLDNLAVVDSIPIALNAGIWALATANNRIFVSAGDATQAIHVIDASTNAKLGQINLPGVCSEMLVDRDNNVIVFTRLKMFRINSQSLSIIKEYNIPGAQVNLKTQYSATCNRSHALDRQNGIIYYLGTAAQPASAPYLLHSYNLNTDVATLLNTNFISGETISFDPANQLILLGDISPSNSDTGVVRMISPQGVLISQFSIKNIPMEILIQP